MVKEREFTAVFGPSSCVKLRLLQSPRAAAIIRHLSNWRSIEDTEGRLWSGMESKHGARILAVRIPQTKFFAIVRMWDSHKAYERALAQLKSGEGKTIEGYQKEAGEFWGREDAKWLVFDEVTQEWMARPEWEAIMKTRAEEEAARDAAREAARLAARQGVVVEVQPATELLQVPAPSRPARTPSPRKGKKGKKGLNAKRFAHLDRLPADTPSDSDKTSDGEDAPLTPPATPEPPEPTFDGYI